MRPENFRASASTATGAKRGIGLQEREENVTAQRTGSVGRITVSRARAMKGLTIVASRTVIQARRGTGLFPPYGGAGGHPDRLTAP